MGALRSLSRSYAAACAATDTLRPQNQHRSFTLTADTAYTAMTVPLPSTFRKLPLRETGRDQLRVRCLGNESKVGDIVVGDE